MMNTISLKFCCLLISIVDVLTLKREDTNYTLDNNVRWCDVQCCAGLDYHVFDLDMMPGGKILF